MAARRARIELLPASRSLPWVWARIRPWSRPSSHSATQLTVQLDLSTGSVLRGMGHGSILPRYGVWNRSLDEPGLVAAREVDGDAGTLAINHLTH